MVDPTIKSIWRVLLLATLLFGASIAATRYIPEAQAQNARQYALTKDSLKRWMESYPRMKMLAFTEAMKRGKDLQESQNPLQAVMKVLSNDRLRADADVAVKDYGFRDFDEWLAVTHATAIAYATLQYGGNEKDVDKTAEKLIGKIQDLDFLSEKQKRKLEKKAREELAKGEALKPTPENLALVTAMKKELDAVVK
jgi:hypothetical protein